MAVKKQTAKKKTTAKKPTVVKNEEIVTEVKIRKATEDEDALQKENWDAHLENEEKQSNEIKMEKQETKKVKSPEDNWEVKDRLYILTGNKSPISFTISSKHTRQYPLMYFDERVGYERELRYATNQQSPFVDEQKGPATLAHIVFRNGDLLVPKNKQNLQKLLSLYHPHRGIVFEEFDPVKEAVDESEELFTQLDAMNAARELELDHAEAILRVEVGSSVSSLDSKEIKRDIMLFARKNPSGFLKLVEDENVVLRNFAIKATEQNIIKLSDDRRHFVWASNNVKLMTVPFDENPYSAFASFLKTDEGMQIYKSIEKKLM